jgi:hypothetical protein
MNSQQSEALPTPDASSASRRQSRIDATEVHASDVSRLEHITIESDSAEMR